MPFANYKDFGSCVADQKSKGKNEESAKKICGSLQAKEEGMNKKILWTEKFDIKEINESEVTESGSKEGKWIKIGGMAVEATVSKNNRKYLAEDLAKQEIKGVKIFMDHNPGNARNAVGVIESQGFDGQKLMYEAKVRNTVMNPDVVEMVRDGLINNVSIGASGDVKRVLEKGNEVYEVHNLKIEELSLVGIGGVPGAGIDFATAVAESFNPLKQVEESKPLKKYMLIRRKNG
jgi:phage head maturation protease